MSLRKVSTVRAVPVSFVGFAPNAAFPAETVYPLPFDAPHLGPNISAAQNGAGNTRIYWHPFVVPQTIVIDRLCIGVTAGNVGSITRLGIYRGSREAMKPTSLLIDAGEIATATQGMKSIPVNVTLVAGELYFYAYTCNVAVANSPTVNGVSGYPRMGVATAGFGAVVTTRFGWSIAPVAFGPLPLDATALALIDPPTGQMGVLWVRIASVA